MWTVCFSYAVILSKFSYWISWLHLSDYKFLGWLTPTDRLTQLLATDSLTRAHHWIDNANHRLSRTELVNARQIASSDLKQTDQPHIFVRLTHVLQSHIRLHRSRRSAQATTKTLLQDLLHEAPGIDQCPDSHIPFPLDIDASST